MTNIVTITANNYCHSVFDGTHATPKPCPNGYKLITSKNITGDGINISDAYFISEQDYFEINKRSKVYQWDILFSMIGTVGNLYLEEKSDIDYAIKNIGVFSCRDEFKAKWLFYYLQSPMARNHIKRFLNGAVQKFLSLKQLRDFPILPFEKDKISIVEILSALDKKIALNKQINARLEQMAKTLYDYWFVQFDFPDANGKPYKSSGGEMVFDETLKREIPKGWEVKSLGDWVEIRKGTLITEKTANTNGDIKVISAGVDFSYYHDVANRPKNTITISASGANAGFVNFWREPIFACDCTTITNSVIGRTLYILNFLKIVQDFIYQQARGSAQPHVYPKDIEGLKIIVPPDLLLKRFSEFVENWNLKIANNEKQNHHLTQLRDFLLPMLMNGQVSVAD
jgi:restriction modification system DNA specificity subunit